MQSLLKGLIDSYIGLTMTEERGCTKGVGVHMYLCTGTENWTQGFVFAGKVFYTYHMISLNNTSTNCYMLMDVSFNNHPAFIIQVF